MARRFYGYRQILSWSKSTLKQRQKEDLYFMDNLGRKSRVYKPAPWRYRNPGPTNEQSGDVALEEIRKKPRVMIIDFNGKLIDRDEFERYEAELEGRRSEGGVREDVVAHERQFNLPRPINKVLRKRLSSTPINKSQREFDSDAASGYKEDKTSIVVPKTKIPTKKKMKSVKKSAEKTNPATKKGNNSAKSAKTSRKSILESSKGPRATPKGAASDNTSRKIARLTPNKKTKAPIVEETRETGQKVPRRSLRINKTSPHDAVDEIGPPSDQTGSDEAIVEQVSRTSRWSLRISLNKSTDEREIVAGRGPPTRKSSLNKQIAVNEKSASIKDAEERRNQQISPAKVVEENRTEIEEIGGIGDGIEERGLRRSLRLKEISPEVRVSPRISKTSGGRVRKRRSVERTAKVATEPTTRSKSEHRKRKSHGTEQAPNRPSKKQLIKKTKQDSDSDHTERSLLADGSVVSVPVQPLPVIDQDTNKIVYIDLFRKFTSVEFSWPDGAPATDGTGDPYVMSISLEHNALAFGFLFVRPKCEKPSERLNEHSLIFNVSLGYVFVTVHCTSFFAKKGDVFIVPRGNRYRIQNLAPVKAKLSFTRING